MNLSANLRSLRRNANLTQEQLADVLGVSFQSISKWERGEGMPDIMLLPSIAKYFHVTIDDLLGMDDELQQANANELLVTVATMDWTHHEEYEKSIAMLREYIKKYPLDWEMRITLAWHIFSYEQHGDNRTNAIRETADILQHVVDYCCNTHWRTKALDMLIVTWHEIGKADENTNDKWRKLLDGVPTIEYSRELRLYSLEKDNEAYRMDAIKKLSHHLNFLKSLANP